RGAPEGVLDHRVVGLLQELVEGHAATPQVGDQNRTLHCHYGIALRGNLRGIASLGGIEHFVHFGVSLLSRSLQQSVGGEFVRQCREASCRSRSPLRPSLRGQRDELPPHRV